MTQPYRVIVWGAGALGSSCIRQVLDRSDVELAGVLVFSESKANMDVGELVGRANVGLRTTQDKNALLALNADCVLHCTRPPFDEEGIHGDVARLLESGKNVISAVAYHYPPFHGPAFVSRFETACRKGGSSLMGSGENPGYFYERLGLTLAGLCNELKWAKLQEISNVSKADPAFMRAIGFGVEPDKVDRAGPLAQLWKKYYYKEMLTAVGLSLFEKSPNSIKHEEYYQPARKRLEMGAGLEILPGTTDYIRHTFTADYDGGKKLSVELHWYWTPESFPEPVTSPEFWRIEIEGRPVSVRCDLNLQNSLVPEECKHDLFMMHEASAAAMIRAIPHVCAAEPGIVYPTVFAGYSPDLRTVVQRSSIVG